MPNHDPGWNDPPTFSYSGSVIGTKRTLLNKRVSFPVSQSYSNSMCSPIGLTPFSGSMNSPVFFPSNVQVSPVNEDTCITNSFIPTQNSVVESKYVYPPIGKTDEETLIYILSVFDDVISKISQDSESTFGKKIDDIKSRLKVFEEMWKANLNPVVKQKMFELAEALSAKRHDEAHALHCNLIVDYVSEVSQWMVAVKHIILISKAIQESIR